MQTKSEAILNVRALLNSAMEQVLREAETLIHSGALDFDSADNDFRLPKVVLVAALRRVAAGYVPREPALLALVRTLEQW